MAPTDAPTLRLVVRPDLAGQRLDQLLAATTPLSRRRARLLIADGAVRRNGELVRVQGRLVAAGDVVDLAAVEGLAGFMPPEPVPVSVLRDDGWLVAVDKPAGVLSQPAEERGPRTGGVAAGARPGECEGDLAMDQRLLLWLACQEGRPPFLRLAHRLDRVTSGVLLFARRAAATAPLAGAWRQGTVERCYLAVVEGEPGWERREVEAPIARAAGGGWRFEVSPRGEPAATLVCRRAVGGGISLVECRLRTGRTHQVRVHLASLGHPVLGDRLYGSRGGAPRPLLHAAWLALPHPADGALVRIEAPLPADFPPALVAALHATVGPQ